MIIKNKNYQIEYLKESHAIKIRGSLELDSVQSYNKIMDFILQNTMGSYRDILFNISELKYINSAGLAFLGLLFIKLREKNCKIKILISPFLKWQNQTIKEFENINKNIEFDLISIQ
jgi:hypothetical protein